MANKNLGIGAGPQTHLFTAPPAIAQEESSIKEHVGRIKAMYARHFQTTLAQARELGKELNALRERCITEGGHQITETIAKTGVPQTTANNYMLIDRNWGVLQEEIARRKGIMGVAEALNYLAELNNEEKPKKKGRKPKRDPGDDRPTEVVKIERAWGTIEKTLADLIRVHDVPQREADSLMVNLRSSIDKAKTLVDLPERPFKSPFVTTCKSCGVHIKMAQTKKHGWIPLQEVPNGGNWEIADNVAERVPFDRSNKKLYEHHACLSRKNGTA